MDLAIGVDGHDPNNSLSVRVASKQHGAGPHPGTVDGVGERRPAQSVIVLGIQVSYEVDVMFHGNSGIGSVFIVRVRPDAVFAALEAFDAVLEVVEGDGEVAHVTPCRVQAKTGNPEDADPHQRQDTEPDEGCLLGQLVDRDVSSGEDRESVAAIDGVVAVRVGSKQFGIQLAATDDDDLVVGEVVTDPASRELGPKPGSGGYLSSAASSRSGLMVLP